MSSDETLEGVRIEIAEDRLAAYLIVESHAKPENLTAIAVDAALATRGVIRSAIMPPAIERAIADFKSAGSKQLKAIVARGRPPIHGIDGGFEAQIPSPTLNASTDADGRIDQHARTRITVVKAGDRLGRMHAPNDGADGQDVFGRSLAAKKPKSVPLTTDDTISIASDGTVTAAVGGIPEFNGRSLRISHTLKISGCVDFSTGNTEFPGDIHIEKGIRDQFTVSAGRDLLVRDLIEAADVSVQRDAVVERGMAARGMGSLVVGRDLKIKYISDCRVSVGHDATVENDVVNCRFTVSRDFSSPNGSVVRGQLTVARACIVGSLGSDSYPPTEVILGRFPEVVDRVTELTRALPDLTSRIAKHEDRLRALQSGGRMTANSAEEITEIQFDLQRDRAVFNRAVAAVNRLDALAAKHTCVDLTANISIFPGVVIFMGLWRVEFTRLVHGPVRLSLDPSGDAIITDLNRKTSSPLNTVARVIRDPASVDIGSLARTAGIPSAVRSVAA